MKRERKKGSQVSMVGWLREVTDYDYEPDKFLLCDQPGCPNNKAVSSKQA